MKSLFWIQYTNFDFLSFLNARMSVLCRCDIQILLRSLQEKHVEMIYSISAECISSFLILSLA